MSNPFITNGRVPNESSMVQMRNMFNMFRNSSNPNMLIDQMIQQNPQMAQVLNLFKGQNVNYEKVFRDLCQQRGIDADYIINNLFR